MDEDMRIRKVSASEQVCEAIQAQISSGVWKVGDKLPSESELAAKFGVNRLTVRMALQKLNALGIVETRTGSGTFVIEFDFESYLKTASRFYEQSGMMQNVTEFRNHIEIECARLAIERATEEDLAELERLALKHREAWADTEGLTHEEWCKCVAAADLAFHEHVCRISHNPLYAYAFAVAREPIHQYMLFCLSKWMPELVRSFRLDKHRDIHYCIYEAIKAKDFAACQSDYAAMIESYTRVNWSMPEVG
ncbi:MAG: FadR/GntR family transcriptional regulator [Oscillospiraceae bacterium]|nr:FadR/GntR family transcriptional regulator [Oscillospiraceae bacterium]